MVRSIVHQKELADVILSPLRLVMAHKSHKGQTRTGGPLSVVEVKASDMQSPKMMQIALKVNIFAPMATLGVPSSSLSSLLPVNLYEVQNIYDVHYVDSVQGQQQVDRKQPEIHHQYRTPQK